MTENPRPLIPGGIYHVMNRGNRKGVIFEDNYDRCRFRDDLVEALDVCGVKLLAESPMKTHFHVDIATPRGNVSEFMAQLEGPFAKYFNKRHEHVGHLFQGPFRSTLVESDLHLFTTLWYIYMNAVKSGIVDAPEMYRWSSYAATVGLAEPPSYLTLDWLEVLFPADSFEHSQRLLRQVMQDPNPLSAYLALGGPDQRQRPIRSYVWEQRQEGSAWIAARPTLEALTGQGIADRAAFIHDARAVHGYKFAEIARHLHMHRSNVAEIFHRFREARLTSDASLHKGRAEQLVV